MVETHRCPYTHTDEPIPFKAYPRPPFEARALAAVEDHDENLLYATDAALRPHLVGSTDRARAPRAGGDHAGYRRLKTRPGERLFR